MYLLKFQTPQALALQILHKYIEIITAAPGLYKEGLKKCLHQLPEISYLVQMPYFIYNRENKMRLEGVKAVISEIEEWDGKRHRVEIIKTEQTLLSMLQEQHIFVDAPCNGNGTCGMCRVQFLSGASEPGEKEKRLLTEAELAEGIRLACVVKIEQDCRIRLLENGKETMHAVTEAGVSCKTPVKPGTAHSQAHRSVSNSVVSYEKAQRPGTDIGKAADYGIAVDIGTTTLAAELVGLDTGQTIAVTSLVNHQRAYGADVISRIQASNEGKKEELQKCMQDDLCRMTAELIKKADIRPQEVKKMVIAGNTTMCHILSGFSCETLGVSPFIPVDISLQHVFWKDISGKNPAYFEEGFSPEVTILPGVSAFVGADIVAGMYACGMAEQEEVVLLLDIGTNGEMVIGNKDGFLATSTAAGPVFEGGNISCGVPGIPGAVTHVTIQKAALEVPEATMEKKVPEASGTYICHCETIANKKAVGLCGTGIIDMVSELVREELIDENGTLKEPWFETGFPLAQDVSPPSDNICFTQRDIREVQLGKAAIRAGMETLIKEYGKMPDKVYLAGGFGFYMDVEKAARIGLFPLDMLGKPESAGNTSLAGAKRFLLEEEKIAEQTVNWIAEHTTEKNLAIQTQFNDLYMKYMFFEE